MSRNVRKTYMYLLTCAPSEDLNQPAHLWYHGIDARAIECDCIYITLAICFLCDLKQSIFLVPSIIGKNMTKKFLKR